MLHGLTKEQCEFAKNRIEGNPATPEEKSAAEKRKKEEAAAWEKWGGGESER